MVFRWVDGAELADHKLELRKGKIQQKVKDRWGGLNASDTCMCSGSVEGRQKASDVQSGTEVDRSGKVGGGRQDTDWDKKREVLVCSEDEEVMVFRLWLAHI